MRKAARLVQVFGPYALLVTHHILLSYPQVIHNLRAYDTDVELLTRVTQN